MPPQKQLRGGKVYFVSQFGVTAIIMGKSQKQGPRQLVIPVIFTVKKQIGIDVFCLLSSFYIV